MNKTTYLLIIQLFLLLFTGLTTFPTLKPINKQFNSITEVVQSSSQIPMNWSYNAVSGAQANQITNGSKNIIVAILDSGIDYRYKEIQETLWINSNEIPNNGIDDDGNGYIDDKHGYNFIDKNSNILDVVGHGTFVASIFTGVSASISGKSDKMTQGIASNVSIMPLKVIETMNDSDEYSMGDFVDAVKYAVQNKANVISLSLSWSFPPSQVVDTLRWAYNQGVLIVSVTGNDGFTTEGISHLSRMNEIIAVGATNSFGERASFSQYGKEIELMAPGENVYGFFQLNGSSEATLEINNVEFFVLPLEFSSKGIVEGEIEYVGLAGPEDVEGVDLTDKIALIDRGGSFFRDKVYNVTNKGAIGAIITNNEEGLFSGTLLESFTVPVVAISKADGITIKEELDNSQIPIIGTLSNDFANTSYSSGTSFAVPHVSATAALMLSVNSELNNTWIRLMLRRTAIDIDLPGYDETTGFGIINASFAVRAAADNIFPNLTFSIQGESNIELNITDNLGLFRLDYGYQGVGVPNTRSSTFFPQYTKSQILDINFDHPIDQLSYYLSIEDLSGNVYTYKIGDIVFNPPNYDLVFQGSDEVVSASWSSLSLLVSLIISLVLLKTSSLRKD